MSNSSPPIIQWRHEMHYRRDLSSYRTRSSQTMPPVLSMPEPICLIENVKGNTLVVNKEAEKILLGISQPVVVIAIVGKYRTGKSYLMNKLAGRRTGFPLGSTIQSKTKGIWMWCVPHPKNPGQTLVLLDTEGLGDVEKGDCKNDAWIFSLAVLLSSAFIFNSLGTIDQQSMDQLHYVTELSKLIKLKSSPEQDETGEYKRYFPSFTWCVRDFCLQLSKNGEQISEDEYLMSSLELKRGTGKNIRDYNLPRECILHFFHSHKCFVFDRPASTKKLQNLERLQESELAEDFVEQAAKFYSYMITQSQVKTLAEGTKVTGRMLAVLAASYVKAIQSGTVPCMENAVLALAEIENTAAVQEAMSKYTFEMDKHVPRFPTETQKEFLNMHMECEKEAIKVFMGRSLNDTDQKYQHNLKKLIDNKMKENCARNENISRDVCRKLLKELSLTIEKDISAGKYSVPGGHELYLKVRQKVIDTYTMKPGKGIKALEVIQEYIDEKKDIEAAIIQSDKTLTENERHLAAERAKVQNATREQQILKQINKNLQQRIDDQVRSFEQHKQMLIEKMEQEKTMMMQQYESLKQSIEQERVTWNQQSESLKKQMKRDRRMMMQENALMKQSMEQESVRWNRQNETLKEKMEQDREMMRQQNESMVLQKMREQEIKLQAGFENQIKARNSELERLRKKKNCIVM